MTVCIAHHQSEPQKDAVPSLKVLAISHACIRAPNRAVYRKLQEYGVHVELLLPERLYKAGEWIVADPDHLDDPLVHRRKMLGRNNRTFRYPDLFELLEERRPDVVFAETDPASLLAVTCGHWCRRNRKHLICQTNENLSWSLRAVVARAGLGEAPFGLAKSLLNLVSRSYVRHVFTTSDAATTVFKAHGFLNASALPIGTDREVFHYKSMLRADVRVANGIEPDELVVAYFGRLVPEKGVDTLLKALRQLKQAKWKLLLNRFETDSEYSRRLVDMIDQFGLTKRVVWFCSQHGNIARLMNASDVTILASRSTPKWIEQFGRVVPEAMACGNVVVVSDSGTPKELVGNGGLVFPEGDDAALAQILQSLIDNPTKCLSLRRNAIRHVHRKLSLDYQARIMANVIIGTARQ